MGSRAITVFALDRGDNLPTLAAVIPVSAAMSDADLARLSPTAPPNLLMLVGSTDLSESIRGTAVGITNATKGQPHNSADANAYGDWGKGTAREAITFPGLNHITILFSRLLQPPLRCGQPVVSTCPSRPYPTAIATHGSG